MVVDHTGDIFGDYDAYTENDVIMDTATWDWKGTTNSHADYSWQEPDEDSAMDDYESALADLEDGLEAQRAIDPICNIGGDTDALSDNNCEVSPQHQPLRLRGGVAEEGLRKEPFIVHFHRDAGQVHQTQSQLDENTRYASKLSSSKTNPWAPFKSEKEYKFAEWAKLRGPGSTAVSELLAIPGVCANLS